MNAQRAPITTFLLASNVLIFVLMQFGIGIDARTFGLVPPRFWAGDGWWMPLTSMFLHGPWWHIAFNMLALWSLGTPMEITLGSQRFAWLYFVSGMGSAFAVLLWHFIEPTLHPTVGASGAIFGLLGALAIFYPNSLMLFFFIPMKARTVVIVVFALSLALMFSDSLSFLSHTGHLGGLIAGLGYARFALGLPLGANVLHQSPGGRGPYFSGGGTDGSTRRGTEAAAREAVDRFFRGVQDAEPGIFTGRSSREKVVNPNPADWEATPVEPSTSGGSDAPPASSVGNAEAPGGATASDSGAKPASTPTPSSASEEAERTDPSGESAPPPNPGGGKRLHFDQETGRFYFK